MYQFCLLFTLWSTPELFSKEQGGSIVIGKTNITTRAKIVFPHFK